MKIIDGEKIARGILKELKDKIAPIKGKKPGLAFVLVGNHIASATYIRVKTRACSETGIQSTTLKLPHLVTEEKLIAHIEQLNLDETIDGIIVQHPLPKQISPLRIIQSISPDKDVDGFHPINLGKLLMGEEQGFVSCTPLGVMHILKHHAPSLAGKHVVIVGRSNIVGKPLASLLMQKKEGANATVTIANSKTKNLQALCRLADVLVVAIGQPHFIKNDMIKEGCVVIDVGINRLGKKLVGDVDFESVKGKASAITPVPGGVGPMTVAMLLSNAYVSYQRKCASLPALCK